MANVFRTVIRIITCIALIICPMPSEKKCEAEFNGTFTAPDAGASGVRPGQVISSAALADGVIVEAIFS